MARRVDPWLILALLLLAVFVVLGLYNGVGEWQDAATSLQQWAAISEITYGVLAAAAIPMLLGKWRGIRSVLRTWAAAVAVAGGVAPVAWGDASVTTGVASGLLAGVIALGVLWIVRRAQVAPL